MYILYQKEISRENVIASHCESSKHRTKKLREGRGFTKAFRIFGWLELRSPQSSFQYSKIAKTTHQLTQINSGLRRNKKLSYLHYTYLNLFKLGSLEPSNMDEISTAAQLWSVTLRIYIRRRGGGSLLS
jgi:hypothetical protein